MMEQAISFVTLLTVALKNYREISRKTYFEAFAWGNTLENMKAYLDKSFLEQKLVNEINNPDSKFYFARYNDKTVRY